MFHTESTLAVEYYLIVFVYILHEMFLFIPGEMDPSLLKANANSIAFLIDNTAAYSLLPHDVRLNLC